MTVSGPDSEGLAQLYPAGPSAEEMAEQEAILAAEIAAGIFEPPPEDELSALLADPDCGPPEGPDAWLGDLASPVLEAILDARAAAGAAGRAATRTHGVAWDGAAKGGAAEGDPAQAGLAEDGLAATGGPATEPFPAAFLVHDGQGQGGAGFGSGSVLDRLEPGPVLAAALDSAWQAGLDNLPDDELAGLVLGWRRCESQAAAGLLAAVSELSRTATALATAAVPARLRPARWRCADRFT